MPKKIIFSKDEIINTAFDIFKQEGMIGISARKIATKLGCSTAPIYISFSNIDELKKVLLDNSLNILLSYTEKEYTNDIFLNIGLGMLAFTKEYGIIYKSLFIESNEYKYILDEFNKKNLTRMKKEKTVKILDEEDMKYILNKLTIFTHGLASLICAGLLEDTSIENLTKELLEAGGDVIGATMYKRGKMEEYLKITEKDE